MGFQRDLPRLCLQKRHCSSAFPYQNVSFIKELIILDSPWYSNSCHKYISRQYILILSGKSFLPLKLSIASSQEKYSQQKNLAYPTDSEYFICLLKKRARL